MHQFFSSTFFNFEALRILGMTCYGGAEVAEFLDAVAKIRQNDPQSWQDAWAEQARDAEALAHDAEENAQREAARRAYLRASNYTRASAYMLTGDRLGLSSPDVAPKLQKARELFRSSLVHFEHPVEILEIPYAHGGGASLPGYLYLPDGSSALASKTPVLVNMIGADSVQEEIYYTFAAAGPGLGYAVLTFEGPGQGLMLHQHGIPMRPDWENVTGCVLDFLERYAANHPEVNLDMDRVAVAGTSLGGYFALRSAADPRCKACVAIDPLYDLYDFVAKHTSPVFFGLWERGWLSDSAVNGLFLLGTRLQFELRWNIFTSGRFLGASSPVEILRAMKTFTMRLGSNDDEDDDDDRSYLRRIACPTFVSGAAHSLYFDVEDHTAKIFKMLPQREKEMWVALTPGQGSLQGKVGALALCNQRVFNFLDRQFCIKRVPVQ